MARNIVIYGRRWFQKLYGNTYFSVQVFIDGEYAGGTNYEYGYGDQYMQRAQSILKDAGIDLEYPLTRSARDAGHTLIYSVSDVQRKKDLSFGGPA